MNEARIVSIEFATLEGTRPRAAGCNARLGAHGQTVRVPLARITADDGAQGFGACTAAMTDLSPVLGRSLSELWDPSGGANGLGRAVDFSLWDLMAKREGVPVYVLAARMAGATPPDALRAPCYDTSLYFDDLHLDDADEAAALIADEARQGWERGHRAFKIKVGRGAKHMPLEAGMRRDAAVVRAVRDAVNPRSPIMLDANNGLNLNLAKRLLSETAEYDIAWLEEAFHEDRQLYLELGDWILEQDLPVLLADGEGDASPHLVDWAEEGVLDVVQYDILSYGFTRWLALGQRLDAWDVASAPHHYGRHYGNFAACHLEAALTNFAFVEWDEAHTPGLDTSAYTIENGMALVPPAPGFGLELDEEVFREAVARNGYRLTWT